MHRPIPAGGLPFAALALLLLWGCRSSTKEIAAADGAARDTADRPADAATSAGDIRAADTTPAADVADTAGDQPPATDAPATDAPAGDAAGGVRCGTQTCSAGELCLITTVAGGVPGSGVSTSYACRPRPGACPAEPDCTCARTLCLAVACACRIPAMTTATVQCDCFAP